MRFGNLDFMKILKYNFGMASDVKTMEKRFKILETLNWDMDVSKEELLDLVLGKVSDVGGITRETLFLRSLERVAWHNLFVLWNSAEECCGLYTEKVRRGLRNDESRQKYDFIFGLLRGEPVQTPEWGSEYCERIRNAFLSDRWNRPEQRLLQA